MILRYGSVPGHDSLVGLLDGVLGWVKTVDCFRDIILDSVVATASSLFTAMIGVSGSVEVRCLAVVSEEHVLRVIVDQVTLLGSELELGDESGDSELRDDLHDIELGIESGAGLSLQPVLMALRMPAA